MHGCCFWWQVPCLLPPYPRTEPNLNLEVEVSTKNEVLHGHPMPHIKEGSTANSALHFWLPDTTKVGLGRHATYSMRHSPLLVGLDLDLI